MSDFLPKANNGPKVGGLSRKAQKLQALRDKAAAQAGGETKSHAPVTAIKAKGNFAPAKKTSFQRKAV